MALTLIDLAVIALYFGGLVLFAAAVRGSARDFGDFSVAHRQVPSLIVFASLSATYIGPGYSLALAGKAFSTGYLFLGIFAFFSIQTIATALFLAPRLQEHSDCHTVGDVMGGYYGDTAHRVVGGISVVLSVAFTAIMAKAGGSVLAGLLDIDLLWGVLIISGVGLSYTLTGGLKAVVATEAIQFTIMVAAVSLLLVFSVLHLDGAIDVTAHAWESTTTAAKEMGVWTLIGLCVAFFFGEMLIPPYANRALAAKTKETSRNGFLFAGIFSIFWFLIVVLIGIAATGIVPVGTEPGGAMVAVAGLVLPEGLRALFVVAIAAIVMSTQESVLNAGAVSFVRDLRVVGHGDISDRAQLVSGRLATVVIGVLGVVVALVGPSIISMLLVAYSIWAPSVAVPLAWALLGLPITPRVGLGAVIGGMAGSVSAVLLIEGAGDNGYAVLLGLIGSVVGLGIASILSRFRRATHISTADGEL